MGLTRRQTIGVGAVGAAAVLAGGAMGKASAATGIVEPVSHANGFSAETKRTLGLILTSGMGAAQIPGMAVGLRDVTASNPAFAGGSGAMISTLNDLKVWAKALATGSLLKPATHKRQLKRNVLVQTPKITLLYGLGITEVNGFLGHDGAIVGYGSVILYLPSTCTTIVILANNQDNGNPAPLAIGLSVAAYLIPDQFPQGL